MIIAHRGESFLAPENSLSSVNLAWDTGSVAVEIDIRLTADNEIIVLHDKDTRRTGDKNYMVARTTFNELRGVDVGIKKSPEFKGERIPSFREVLDTIPSHGKLITEIKCGQEIIPFIIRSLNNTGISSDRIEFISYNSRVLSALKNFFPDIRMLRILDLDYYLPKWLLRPDIDKLIRNVIVTKLDGVDVWAGRCVDEIFLKKFRDAGLSVYTWTVNDVSTAKKLLNSGADAVTTDRAAWLRGRMEGVLI